MGLAIVVVVDNEGAEEVAAGGKRRNDVAVFLAVRDGEEAEGLLVGVVEVKRLGDDGGGASREVAVREEGSVEGVRGVGGASTVNVIS